MGGIPSTYIKPLPHCNHNQPFSIHMSAPIPLKSAFLLETERVGCDFTVYCQTACIATERRGDTTLINSLQGIVYVRMFVSTPRYLNHEYVITEQ